MTGSTRFRETIERMNSAKKISRVLRRDNNRSSHEPIRRSRVTFNSKKSVTTSSETGSSAGDAAGGHAFIADGRESGARCGLEASTADKRHAKKADRYSAQRRQRREEGR